MTLSHHLWLFILWLNMYRSLQQRDCTKPVVPNGFAAGPFINKAYYTCKNGYKLFTKSWWGVVKCNDGVWSELQPCIEKHMCGEPPVIPNGKTTPVNTSGHAQTLAIVCKEGYHTEISQITCLNGKWDSNGVSLRTICRATADLCGPPPKCKNALIMNSYQDEYSSDSEVTYQCRKNFLTEGETTIKCKAGSWEKKTINCIPYCNKLEDDNMTVKLSSYKERYINGDAHEYVCLAPYANDTGTAFCVNGKWRKTVECQGCGIPPPISDGDTEEHVKSHYRENERVKYSCQLYYVLEGEPYKACIKSQWTGEIRCLKPCIMYREDIDRHNIQILRRDVGTLYLRHEEQVIIVCKAGTRPEGNKGLFLQMCNDGVISLPTCQ